MRRALAGLLIACAGIATLGAAEIVRAVRVWPAQEYTRLTFESRNPIGYAMSFAANPDRLSLDLQDVDHSSLRKEIEAKILADDPYVKGLRIGRENVGQRRRSNARNACKALIRPAKVGRAASRHAMMRSHFST